MKEIKKFAKDVMSMLFGAGGKEHKMPTDLGPKFGAYKAPHAYHGTAPRLHYPRHFRQKKLFKGHRI